MYLYIAQANKSAETLWEAIYAERKEMYGNQAFYPASDSRMYLFLFAGMHIK